MVFCFCEVFFSFQFFFQFFNFQFKNGLKVFTIGPDSWGVPRVVKFEEDKDSLNLVLENESKVSLVSKVLIGGGPRG